jgi:hypothetical protein
MPTNAPTAEGNEMRSHDNDNDPFGRLPMFASDIDIATAIVGKASAAKWVKEKLPTLASKQGFPKVDDFHGGRAVPLVRLFYNAYLGITAGTAGAADQEEGTWGGRKR